MAPAQARYWLLTIKEDAWSPPSELPDGITWLRGQLEQGESGFRHWQICCAFGRAVRLAMVKSKFCNSAHCEPTRSDAAGDYVWKEATRIDGTQFELGFKPVKANSKVDWERVWEAAKSGRIDDVPANVRLRHYHALRTIRSDFARPTPMERSVCVLWGRTGTGKSRRAWDEAGLDAYPKDPRTKFWDGYQSQTNVVLDEFRGAIDIAHLLRWLDRYPVIVEVKGSAMPLCATKFWITSNIDPRRWYPDADSATVDALMRRFTEVVHFE